MSTNVSHAFSQHLLRSQPLRALLTVGVVCAACAAWNRHLNAEPTVSLPTPAPLPRPNAYEDFTRAVALHKEGDIYTYTSSGKRKALTPAQVDAVFAQNAAAVAALEVGLTHEYQMTSTSTSETPYTDLRSLARTVGFESEQEAARGNLDRALAKGLDVVQMGTMLAHGGGVTDRLVGIACESMTRRRLWALVGRLNGSQAADAAHWLESIDAMRTPLSDSLQTEKWRGMEYRQQILRGDSLMQAFTNYRKGAPDDGTYSDRNKMANDSRQMFVDWASLMQTSKQQVVDNYARWMDAQAEMVKHPYTPRHTTPMPPLDAFNNLTETDNRIIQFKDVSDRMDNGLLTLAFALRAFQQKTGAYPASLGELVTAGLLRRVPDDPLAPKLGTAFPYQRVSGAAYRLYSVGPDGVDNGGAPVVPTTEGRSADYLDMAATGDWVVGVNVGAADSERVTSSVPH